LMKFVFMKSDLITKRERERKTERKEAFGPTTELRALSQPIRSPTHHP
jgi:hypothetical protein